MGGRWPRGARRVSLVGLLLLAAGATAPRPAPAQEGTAGAAPSDTAAPAPFHLQVGGYFHQLDGGYGSWRGMDLRLQYASPRFTPMLLISSQTRDQGTQQSVGLASYVVLNRWAYSIVGLSAAPAGEVTLFPQLRLDVSLMASVPGVSGLVASAGITGLHYRGPAGGSILSLGSIYYRGPAILNGVVRINRDRLSGDLSRSWQLGGQFGAQGRSWIGGSIGGGNEAYTVLAATPFEARFEGVGASLFWQRWTSRSQGFAVRYDFENKFDAYRRHGLTASYFIDFGLP